jgi:hypothetical protein
MKTLTVAAWLAVTATTVAAAQPPAPPDPTAQREAMARLGFLVGEWEGEGWISRGPDQRETFRSWERVQVKLGGTVLLVEGLHKAMEDGRVVHDALAMISWHPEEGRYRVDSYLANGRGGVFPGELEDGAFTWTPSVPGGPRIRYTFRLDEEGRWFETGEISTDGQGWRQFFEMRLVKKGG